MWLKRTPDTYTDEQMMDDHMDSLKVYYNTHPHLEMPEVDGEIED